MTQIPDPNAGTTAAPEVRQATVGQTIKAAGNVIHTLAAGQTLIELPGTDILYQVGTATPIPTPTPTPTPPPVLPPLTRKVAPPVKTRGMGVEWNGPGARSLTDYHVQGYSQNVTVQRADSLALTNFRSVWAYRDEPTPTDAKMYQGQGLYIRDIAGPVRIKGHYSAWNGWQQGKPIDQRTQYRHAGIYADFNTPDLVIEDFIWAAGSACGGQFRGGGTLRHGVIIDCGIGVLASMGTLTLEDVTIYGGNYYWTRDQHGQAWTGMVGAAAYWPLSLKSDVWIVGKPDQASGDATVKASGIVRKYPGPAIQLNVQKADPAHPDWKPPPPGVPLVTVGPGCVVAGWPLNPMSPTTFGGSGMTPAAAAELAKIHVTSTPVAYEYQSVLADVEANRISIYDAVDRIKAGVRGAVA